MMKIPKKNLKKYREQLREKKAKRKRLTKKQVAHLFGTGGSVVVKNVSLATRPGITLATLRAAKAILEGRKTILIGKETKSMPRKEIKLPVEYTVKDDEIILPVRPGERPPPRTFAPGYVEPKEAEVGAALIPHKTVWWCLTDNTLKMFGGTSPDGTQIWDEITDTKNLIKWVYNFEDRAIVAKIVRKDSPLASLEEIPELAPFNTLDEMLKESEKEV